MHSYKSLFTTKDCALTFSARRTRRKIIWIGWCTQLEPFYW